MRIRQQIRHYVHDTRLLKACTGLCLSLSLMAGTALADWQLQPTDSSLTFTSTKNVQITEAHSFTSLTGAVDSHGAAQISIALASVETQVPIRNERLQVMLFEAQTYPMANITANLTLDPMLALAVGQSMTQEITLTIDLHGISQTRATVLNVERQASTVFVVTNIEPLLIDVADFELVDGFQALREIAGLKSITPIVPVNFSLKFLQQP
ncbi:MAG: polyisoprenoid-binding protein YceI [Cyclobacteriaceae bacterium]|jgi:polyisoprenoid-binding protein YceI